MELKIPVTMKDIQRYQVIKDCLDRKAKAVQASLALGLSYRHLLRLKQKVAKLGIHGLLRPKRTAHNKIPESKANIIAGIYKEHYEEFNLNIMHFMDKLRDIHKIKLSYESIRKILIKNNLHHPKTKKKVHRRRRRMPKAGMLLQMDSSFHNWLPNIKDKWWLIAIIDDASSEVPYASFFPKDTLLANMHVIRETIKQKGLFMSLYADKASHFKTTRHGGLHVKVDPEQDDTQIERALAELGIKLIPANSPQAKGRIERLFGFFQDRLIKELQLASIKDYDLANQFLLDKFLPWYNKKYTHKVESLFVPPPPAINYNLIFCDKKERIVNMDNTVQYKGQIIQIPPTDIRLSFAKAKVYVCLLENDQILITYNNQIIYKTSLSKYTKQYKYEKSIERFLNKRDYAVSSSCKM